MKVTLGKKIGMTQIYDENGKVIPVTLVQAEGVKVAKHLKTQTGDQVELGIDSVKHPNQADMNNYKKLGFVPRFKFVFQPENIENEDMKIGTDVNVGIFSAGDKIDVIGTTKGKGFQGVVKRWGFKGGPKTHGGTTGKHRSPGSIGSGTTPGRVLKGKKMARHMGNVQQTTQNLRVAMVDEDNSVIGIRGAVPGSRGSYLVIKTALYSE